jgi:hypothetical protein
MSFDGHKNFSYSTVATAPSPATSGTSLVVQSGDGTKFPGTPFNATIWPVGAKPTTANAEIVRVTTVSTDTLTITRAQESSSARTVVIGDQIAATVTAKTLTDVEVPGTGAANALVTTSESTASTSYVDLTTTTDSVTVVIGANGLAFVMVGCLLSSNSGGSLSYMGFAASSGNTIAAADARALAVGAVGGLTQGQTSWGYLATGLSAGSTVFKAKYRVSAGTTTFSNRYITVIPF